MALTVGNASRLRITYVHSSPARQQVVSVRPSVDVVDNPEVHS
jgi:hypothetical protein